MCCFRTQLNVYGIVNVAWSLLLGHWGDRGQPSATRPRTQSKHIDDLFLLIEECLFAVSERSSTSTARGPCCSGECGQPAATTQSVHVDDLFLLIEECLCAVSERSSTSNVARSLLLGCARSTFCNKTQSNHIENLFVLIEECLCAFSERSDAQEGQSKKSSAAAKDRHPKPIPSQHPDDNHTRYGLALVRVCRLHPPPGARGSTFPRLHQQQHFARHRKHPPRARERVRVSTPSATTTSVSSMSSQASLQAPRDRVSTPAAA